MPKINKFWEVSSEEEEEEEKKAILKLLLRELKTLYKTFHPSLSLSLLYWTFKGRKNRICE